MRNTNVRILRSNPVASPSPFGGRGESTARILPQNREPLIYIGGMTKFLGQTQGLLTVIGSETNRYYCVVCLCICGKIIKIPSTNWSRGTRKTRSCGCLDERKSCLDDQLDRWAATARYGESFNAWLERTTKA